MGLNCAILVVRAILTPKNGEPTEYHYIIGLVFNEYILNGGTTHSSRF